ncbi:hypothetical protein M422DRAFT_197447 [Sphaerobolus stellatus SS14]|nr:hypothetical protein M422DRAFT_197447 [Sphaerobolus stellatus SS14]
MSSMPSAKPVQRHAFLDRTNASGGDQRLKRHVTLEEESVYVQKRRRVEKETQNVQDIVKSIAQNAATPTIRNITVFRTLQRAGQSFRRVNGCHHEPLSSRPLLESFVSSHKSDVYNLHSKLEPTGPALPFACAFTTSSKNGGIPLLAIATQEGSVEILNLSKRQDWDPEPQRESFNVHDNAILDIKWTKSDEYLATASGDSTVRITGARSGKHLATLAGHSSSVKTLQWDPNHTDLLVSGGRDGNICIWDLRSSDRDNKFETALAPVVVITNAHRNTNKRGQVAKQVRATASGTVTSILHLPNLSSQIVSGGSLDAKLRQWDLRYPIVDKIETPLMAYETPNDPTLSTGQRGRGIVSLALGRNKTTGYIWGLAAGSNIHTYSETLCADSLPQGRLTHPNLFVKSFYIKLAGSPCGSWLASGSSEGGLYLWDVASRTTKPRLAVELKAAGREIGAIDWASDSLAACCDDGTVRVWRPDFETAAICRADPSEKRWDWAWAMGNL